MLLQTQVFFHYAELQIIYILELNWISDWLLNLIVMQFQIVVKVEI